MSGVTISPVSNTKHNKLWLAFDTGLSVTPLMGHLPSRVLVKSLECPCALYSKSMAWIWILLNESCLQRDMLAVLVSPGGPWEEWLGYTACLHATCKQTWLLAVLAPVAHDPRRPCFGVTHCLLKSVGLKYWVTYLPYLAKCGFLYSHCFLLYWWVCIKLYWCCGTVLYYYMLVGTKNVLVVLVEKSIPLCVSVRDCLFFYHSAEAHIVRTEQSCLMVSGLCDPDSCDVHIRGML